MTSPDAGTAAGGFALVRGRFEARFDDVEAAKAAARDARAVGFSVDVRGDAAKGWLIVGRRKLPFPTDERDRYASRVQAIAVRHGGTFHRFVEEPTDGAGQPPIEPGDTRVEA
jgi:hypothetical protein